MLRHSSITHIFIFTTYFFKEIKDGETIDGYREMKKEVFLAVQHGGKKKDKPPSCFHGSRQIFMGMMRK
jgi:hypothetical protein